jgi:hypothetical protein
MASWGQMKSMTPRERNAGLLKRIEPIPEKVQG